jgi:hypothetical protein
MNRFLKRVQQEIGKKYLKAGLLLGCLLLACSVLLAGDGVNKKKQKEKKKAEQVFEEVPTPDVQYASLADLDAGLLQQQGQFQVPMDVAEQEYQIPENVFSGRIDSLNFKAKKICDDVEGLRAFVNFLDPAVIHQLPIGLSKTIGNTKVLVAVSGVIFKKEYAELTVFAKVSIPQKNKSLFFGATGIKLSYSGGIIGDAKLALLGDVSIPFNNGSATVVLKGGFDMSTGQVLDKTFVTIDCNGFKELGIAADLLFPRSMLVPVNLATGEEIGTGNVKGSFSTIVTNWNDILVNISLTPFAIKGLKGFNFEVGNAVFDFSDVRKSDSVVYPAGYQDRYIGQQPLELWRGVYVHSLRLQFPKQFKKGNGIGISIGVEDLIVDNNGITGNFYAENIANNGNASGWQYSLDSIRVNLEANRLKRAAFAGGISVPLAKDTRLLYKAVITSASDYVISITNRDTLAFSVWGAEAKIEPNSYINLRVVNDVFRPEAMLTGTMKMGIGSTQAIAGGSSDSKALDFEGIIFRQLLIKTTAPKMSVNYFGYNGRLKLGNFPLSIDQIGITAPASGNEMALSFRAIFELQNGAISAKSTLRLVGSWDANEGLESISFKRLEIGSIDLKANIGGFKMDGSIAFLENDPVYGNGFRGSIDAKFGPISDDLKIGVTAVFGSKPTYKYWYFDGLATLPGEGIGMGAMKIHGFGGGAYYRMTRSYTAAATTQTGVGYVPDSTAGLGLKASIMFNLVTKRVANGEASMEIAFNNGGGLRYLGLFGAVMVSGEIPGLTNMANFLKDKYKAILQKEVTASVTGNAADNMKMYQPNDASEIFYPRSLDVTNATIAAVVGVQYDFNNKVFDASMRMYMKVAGGILRGAGANNVAGTAKLHIEPSRWYLHIGRPSDRVGLKFGIGGLSVSVQSYLMVGEINEPFPAPPQAVQQILGNYNSQPAKAGNRIADIASGNGFALGSSFDLSTGDIKVLIFYANISAGLGFDLFIRDLGNRNCVGSNDRIGLNGWYMDGQAYAYFAGSVGIDIDVWFASYRLEILSLSAAALLEVHMPNPTWFRGAVGCRYAVLSGLVSGSCNFSFKIGNDCVVETQISNDMANAPKAIAKLTPDGVGGDASTLAAPSATFNMPIQHEINVDPYGNMRMRTQLEEMKLYKGTQAVNTNLVYNQAKSLAYLVPIEPNRGVTRLEAFTDYKFVVKVFFEELQGENWVVIRKNGAKFIETKEVTFRTGAQPDTITPDNVAYSWPVRDQKNFYKGESSSGYIKLRQWQSNLFTSFSNYYVSFKDNNGVELVRPIDVDEGSKMIRFDFPAGLQNNRTYIFRILGRNVGIDYDVVETQQQYKETSGGSKGKPTLYNVLSTAEIALKYDTEVENFLAQHGMSATAIHFFFGLTSESQQLAYLKGAGFSGDVIGNFLKIHENVIRQLLFEKGYGESVVNTYMEELYRTIEVSETQAKLVTLETSQRPLIEFPFRVSDYNTFGEKIQSLTVRQHVVGRVSSDVINLQAICHDYEGFDSHELTGIETYGPGGEGQVLGSGFTPTISFEAVQNDPYYQSSIRSLIYGNASPNGWDNFQNTLALKEEGTTHEFHVLSRPIDKIGLIPQKAVFASGFYVTSIGGGSSFSNQRFPFVYNLPEYYNKDFLELRTKVINHYFSQNQSVPRQFEHLTQRPFPFMNSGSYQVLFKYRLPDGTPGTQGVFTFRNEIQ